MQLPVSDPSSPRGSPAWLVVAVALAGLACRSTKSMPPAWSRPADWLDVKVLYDGALRLADGTVLRVAGVAPWMGKTEREDVHGFLMAATRQGIRVERTSSEGGVARITCAPYFVGPERSRWEDATVAVLDLGELLVATGYASVGDLTDLSADEAERLACAEAIAQFFRWGPWSRERRRELEGLPGGSFTWHGDIYRYDYEASRGLLIGVEGVLRCACPSGSTEATVDCQDIASFARERIEHARRRSSDSANVGDRKQ